MSQRRINQVDESTGEVLGGFVAVVRPRQNQLERHFTMNQSALLILANTLNGEQLRVLLAFLAELDYENFIQVAQADIAEKLNINKVNVSRSVKALIDVGVIFEGPKVGRSKTYRLNEQFGWKGSVPTTKSP